MICFHLLGRKELEQKQNLVSDSKEKQNPDKFKISAEADSACTSMNFSGAVNCSAKSRVGEASLQNQKLRPGCLILFSQVTDMHV